MSLQKQIDRLIRRVGICPHCHHDKARSSSVGVFCMRCKKDINKETDESKIKPMRQRGSHHKENWKRRHKTFEKCQEQKV